jgi:NTE family protein
VFVSATHVTTGKAVVFTGKQAGRARRAGLGLPAHAVPGGGDRRRAYWDGGYSVNPALSPLIGNAPRADLVLVQINPLAATHAASSAEIPTASTNSPSTPAC